MLWRGNGRKDSRKGGPNGTPFLFNKQIHQHPHKATAHPDGRTPERPSGTGNIQHTRFPQTEGDAERVVILSICDGVMTTREDVQAEPCTPQSGVSRACTHLPISTLDERRYSQSDNTGIHQTITDIRHAGRGKSRQGEPNGHTLPEPGPTPAEGRRDRNRDRLNSALLYSPDGPDVNREG